MDSTFTGITITRNQFTGSARIEIELGSDRYVIRDPFGAAIDGVPSLERAIEIATGLAQNVREWAGETTFDC